uniref:Uncharacterized protein n=1 Tax=Oryza barthii TaxID=65489 RepID=A0A0D3GMA3_9ORYZ
MRSSAYKGWPAGGAGAVVPHVGRGDERRVKTQPGLDRTDNDGFPLLRALPCRLILEGCLPGESPVLALLSP